MNPQPDSSLTEAAKIRDTLNCHSRIVEHNINKIRFLIILVGAVTDTLFLTLSGKVDIIKGSYLPLSCFTLIVMTGYFLMIHRLTAGDRYRAWVKYLVVTIDYAILFVTFFDLFQREEFKEMFSPEEMLWMSSFSLIIINALSMLRVEKRVIIFGTALALAINTVFFSITAGFSSVLFYGSLCGILFFGILNIWIARNVAKKLSAALRLSMTRDALAETNMRLSQTLDELRAAETHLVQSEKMAALGKLAAGIAHEVNNPIGAIISSADVIQRCNATIEEALHKDDAIVALQKTHPKLDTAFALVRENSDSILLAGSRVNKIIKSMKNFVRLDEAEYQKVDIHEGIESTLAILRHETKNITIVKNFRDVPPLTCSPNQLNQVFMNLIMNAVQAMDGTGRLTLTTDHSDNKIIVTCTDSGKGVRPEHLDKVFDAGFTTKGVGVGTGLGLSISYAIIKKHRGSITVTSDAGQGTTFTVTLPVT